MGRSAIRKKIINTNKSKRTDQALKQRKERKKKGKNDRKEK